MKTNKKIIVEVLCKSKCSGYYSKVYEFNNEAHMEAFMNKWAVKMGIDQVHIVNGSK